MKKTILLLFICTAFILSARDFREPVEIIDPLYSEKENENLFFTDFYSEIRYQQHIFQNAPTDDFDIGIISGFTLFNFKNQFAINAYYSNYNMMSPFAEGDNVVNIMRWWMSGFEIEYGISGAAEIGPVHILLEYSRTSQHPLLPYFSEVAADTIKGGILINDLSLGSLKIIPSIRYTDRQLLDIWESVLPDPDLFRIIDPEIRLSYPLTPRFQLFGDYTLEWDEYHSTGWQISSQGETGIQLIGKKANMEIFHGFYNSQDTEVLRKEKSPVNLSGIGIRFSNR